MVAVAVVVLTGLICLPLPFWGDQALFAVYGRQLADGAVLYRDLFDLKQPGVFVFYATAGMVFGFTEVGVHLFELLYWLAFCAFVLVALRPYFTAHWAPGVGITFTAAAYYLSASMLDLTQIEALVGFPILLAWWLADGAVAGTPSASRRYAVAGVLLVVVAGLKYLYVIVVVALLASAVWQARRRGASRDEVLRWTGVLIAAAAITALAAVAYFAWHGQLSRIWLAFVEYPLEGRTLDPEPVTHLIRNARRFALGHAPLVILAGLGAVASVRREMSAARRLGIAMLLWLAVGGVALLAQFWAPWHWLLFTVPTGVLAAIGVEHLAAIARLRRPQLVAAAVGMAGLGVLGYLVAARAGGDRTWLLMPVLAGIAAALILPLPPEYSRVRRSAGLTFIVALGISLGLSAVAPAEKLTVLARNDLGLTSQGRATLRADWNPAYPDADEDLERLQRAEKMAAGPVYVFGDPVVLLRAGRHQAVPIHGWGPEKLTRSAWVEIEQDLNAEPPAYVVVSEMSALLIRERHPGILDLLASRYELLFKGRSGTWYGRRDRRAALGGAE